MMDKVISHYRILEKLGEGGMGVVYKAEDLTLTRTVALKFLPRGLEAHEPERARFLQEARAAAILNHPNICTIHEIAEADGQQFIVMEFVDGRTLREIVPVAKLQNAITYGIQIAEALHEAHTHGIVHRDIKAENIMVNSKNQVKVMDFGLAKLKGSLKLTKTSSTIGTLAYMAPEQIQGEPVDARSDIFSFGVVLYEMLTGHLPFRGEHEGAMMYSIINEDPEPLETYRTDLSPVLANLIQRALEKNPAERYQSAEEMAIELRRLQKKTTRLTRTQAHLVSAAAGGAQPAGEEAAGMEPRVTTTRAHFQRKLQMFGLGLLAVGVLLAAVYLVFIKETSTRPEMFSLQSMKVIRLTTGGNARSAAVSPDGKYVVYSTDDSGRQSLWLRQVATSSNVQIIPASEGYYFGLTFSHDGNYIYYGMMQASTGLEAVYRVPVLGGSPRKILDHVESSFTLSPDDKEFAFVHYFPSTGEFALMVAKTDGTGDRRLATHKGDQWFTGQPSWSPDGTMIACPLGSYEAGGYTTVITVGLDGAVERRFTSRRWGNVYQVEWFPDGSGMFVRARDQGAMTSQVFAVSYPEGEAVRITNDLLEYASVSVTRDAQTLCAVQGDYRGNILVLPGGSAQHAEQITFGKDEGLPGIGWTPEGRIVYGTSVGGTFDLWMMDRYGKNQRQLTADPWIEYQCSVSPDGRFVLFVSEGESSLPNVWRIELDGSQLRQLTTTKDNYNPSVSPDGQWFVFDSWATGINLIMRQSMSGGEPVQLSDTPGSNPVVSPDGKLVAFTYLDEQTRHRRIEVIPAGGGAPVKEFHLPYTASSVSRWSRDGRAIHFLVEAHGATNLWSQPLVGGPPKQITDFKSELLSEFDWSFDGKDLAVVRYTATSDVLLMSREK